MQKSLWAARLAILMVILAIASSFFGDRVLGRGHKSTERSHDLELMLALQLPFAVAGLLIARGPSRFGLGFAAAAPLTLLVPLLPVTVMSAIFAGFGPNLWVPGSLAALVAALIMLAVASVMALRRVAPPGERGQPLSTGFGVSLAWALVVVFYSMLLGSNERLLLADLERSDARAEALVAEISRCAQTFAEANPQQGYPPDLAALGPGGSGCLPDTAETQGGFRLVYLASPPGGNGRRASFSTCARPERYFKSGYQTFVANSTALTPDRFRLAPTREESFPCAGAWESKWETMGSALHFCLLSYASAHPDRGFPRQLRALSNCETKPYWNYEPAPPRPDGRIIRYQAKWMEGGRTLYVTDETGATRAVPRTVGSPESR